MREYITLTVEQSKLAKLKDLGASLVGCVDAEEAQSLLAQANRIAGGRPSVRVVSMEQGLLDGGGTYPLGPAQGGRGHDV